jgi:3-phenylpropionate/trans-cinnamate dioxygenase ferredoxin component
MTDDFVVIGTTDELEPGGEPLVVDINRRWVAVYNIAGEFYAIEDRCTHDDGPLADGDLEGVVVKCPRHGACFDVKTGEFLRGPAGTVDVPTYAVRLEGDNILVGPRRK